MPLSPQVYCLSAVITMPHQLLILSYAENIACCYSEVWSIAIHKKQKLLNLHFLQVYCLSTVITKPYELLILCREHSSAEVRSLRAVTMGMVNSNPQKANISAKNRCIAPQQSQQCHLSCSFAPCREYCSAEVRPLRAVTMGWSIQIHKNANDVQKTQINRCVGLKDQQWYISCLCSVEFLISLGSQSGVSVWQHTLVG